MWLSSRLCERLSSGGGAAVVGASSRAASRALADAGLRWMHARGVSAPAGRAARRAAPRGADDRRLGRAARRLRAALPAARTPSAEAPRRLDALQVALGDLGFALTRQGIRRVGGEVDRVLLSSAAKPLAMCDALACEYDAPRPGLRAVVLCDSERPPRQPAGSPLTLTGGGRGLLAAVGADERLIGSRPALVTGETFAVLRGRRATWWAARLAADLRPTRPPAFAEGLRARRPTDGLVVLAPRRRAASTRRSGRPGRRGSSPPARSQVLVGTRGLLGEGWDCPPVNVLVDMTAVAADVSCARCAAARCGWTRADPAKLANNWDVVCVAPRLGRGHADYGRFVRRHAHLHAPCEDGTIETGPSHVHPELSPYGPPEAERFVAINIEQQERAADRDAARRAGTSARPTAVSTSTCSSCATRAVPTLRNGAPSTLAAVAPPRWRWLAGRRAYPEHLPLEWAAAVVCEAYVALGELPAPVAASMQFTVRPEGWVRVSLPDADVQISRQVSAALDELFGGGGLARYVVSRKVVTGALPFLGRRTVWHAVPADLGRRKERAEAFAAAWRRWMGRSELVYCHGTDPRGRDLAVQASALAPLETQRRRIWR